MAEFSNVPRSSSAGWIIGAVVVAAVLVFIIFSGLPPADPNSVPLSDGATPAVETQPVPAVPVPATDN